MACFDLIKHRLYGWLGINIWLTDWLTNQLTLSRSSRDTSVQISLLVRSHCTVTAYVCALCLTVITTLWPIPSTTVWLSDPLSIRFKGGKFAFIGSSPLNSSAKYAGHVKCQQWFCQSDTPVLRLLAGGLWGPESGADLAVGVGKALSARHTHNRRASLKRNGLCLITQQGNHGEKVPRLFRSFGKQTDTLCLVQWATQADSYCLQVINLVYAATTTLLRVLGNSKKCSILTDC